jgi:hypothetical protein
VRRRTGEEEEEEADTELKTKTPHVNVGNYQISHKIPIKSQENPIKIPGTPTIQADFQELLTTWRLYGDARAAACAWLHHTGQKRREFQMMV